MDEPSWPIDAPTCRIDLVRKAAASTFGGDFTWINEKEAMLAVSRADNRGLTDLQIRDLARKWICAGNTIKCVPENRERWKHRRHFHYDIIIGNLADLPRGLFVEMELTNPDEDEPEVHILSAHPPSR